MDGNGCCLKVVQSENVLETIEKEADIRVVLKQ